MHKDNFLKLFSDGKAHVVNPIDIYYTAFQYTGERENKIDLYEFHYGEKPNIFDPDFLKEPENSEPVLSFEDGKVMLLSLSIGLEIKKKPIELCMGDIVIKIERELSEDNYITIGYMIYDSDDFIEKMNISEPLQDYISTKN